MKLFSACALAAILALAAAPGSAQEGAPPKLDRNRVKQAIAGGVNWLKTQTPVPHNHVSTSMELFLWTFVHAGVPEDDPKFKEYFDKMLADPLEHTYRVALQVMILEEVNRVKHQGRIWQCAQWLVNNQCKNGQWSYGQKIPLPPPPRVRSSVKSGGDKGGLKKFGTKPSPGPRVKPKVERRLPVRQTRTHSGTGDNSNSQYAALGIRACHEAGIVFPKAVIVRAAAWWRQSQSRNDLKTGRGYGGAGWGYAARDGHASYGAMTAGAVGSLAIYDYVLGVDWKKDPAVKAGVQWLARNFSVTEHKTNNWEWQKLGYFYYMYALERAGVLVDTDRFGKHFWYEEGANVLLQRQMNGQFWGGFYMTDLNKPGKFIWHHTWDTCFAILFLKRATERLDVASTDKNTARAGTKPKPTPPRPVPAPPKPPVPKPPAPPAVSSSLGLFVQEWADAHAELLQAYAAGKDCTESYETTTAALKIVKRKTSEAASSRLQVCIETYADIHKRTAGFTKVPADQSRAEVLTELKLTARVVKKSLAK